MTPKDTTDGWEKRFNEKFGGHNANYAGRFWLRIFEDIKFFISEVETTARKEGYEEGQSDATPEYKKDMQDAYEKGRKEEIKNTISLIFKTKPAVEGQRLYEAIMWNIDHLDAEAQILSTLEELK